MICTIDGPDENKFGTESTFCLTNELEFLQLFSMLGAG